MTSLETALRRIHTDLTEAQIGFALVGGLAVSARTEPRFTRDADLAVAIASDAEAEGLIHRISSTFGRFCAWLHPASWSVRDRRLRSLPLADIKGGAI